MVQRLAEVDATHQPRLLRVLERIGDPGTLSVIRPLLTHAEPDVAVAAVDAMGALLDARDTAVAAAALDALTGTLLDTTRDDVVRLRAFEAIGNAGDRSDDLRRRRARTAARATAHGRIRSRCGRAVTAPRTRRPMPTSLTGEQRLEAAANGDLPDDAGTAAAGDRDTWRGRRR